MREPAPVAETVPEVRPVRRITWTHEVLPSLVLMAILAIAAYLRFTGLNWDDYTHIHPDERFLTMVESGIDSPDKLSGYFDTAVSPLNPNNRGYGFFVYGTLPVFLVRFVAEAIQRTGYDEVHLVGRAASAAFDLVSVWLVYLVGSRLYRKRVGLLAALFAALSVMLIQQAHFFVVDSFANTFVLAGLYFAVRVLDRGAWEDYLGFGAALGMAVASKLSAVPLAAVVCLAVLPRLLGEKGRVVQPEVRKAVLGLAFAAAVSIVVFRICQPYAFAGPGFFGIRLNPQWVANIREQRSQARGNVDMPPNLQWFDRTPYVFPWVNLVVWGLGFPLGLASWAAWGAAIVESVRGRWRRHLIPIVWTGAYFVWQASTFNPSMRYFLPVYPTLALLAAWGLWEAWDRARGRVGRSRVLASSAVGFVGVAVIVSTAIWAFAFVSIYTRPATRVAASEWIFSHLPGAVNVVVDTADGSLLEVVPVPQDFVVAPGAARVVEFHNNQTGTALNLAIPYALDLAPQFGPRTLRADVLQDESSTEPIAVASGTLGGDTAETALQLSFEAPVELEGGVNYVLRFSVDDGAFKLGGPVTLTTRTPDGDQTASASLDGRELYLPSAEAREFSFVARLDGPAAALSMPYVQALSRTEAALTLKVTLLERQDDGLVPVATGMTLLNAPSLGERAVQIPLSPGRVRAGGTYVVRLEVEGDGGLMTRGSVIASESTWDDGLPLRLAGGMDIGGRYTGVNQEMYWQDDQDDNRNGVSDKLERIVETLSEADILAISSNRQYGTVPRVSQRYPVSEAYYRALVGCEAPRSVSECMAQAQPGKVHGELGYDLIAVFQNDPRLGPLSFNDQYAEEAFTVYDHPKVLIFARTQAFSAEALRARLAAIDLSTIVHLLPSDKPQKKVDLMLPADRLEGQRAGGTWSVLFDRGSVVNRSDVVATIAWWLLVGLIGWAAFPLTRLMLPGLRDGGYPLARIVGLVLTAWLSWVLSSLRVPFTRGLILAVLLAVALASSVAAWLGRMSLLAFLRERRREIAWVEVLALALFLLDLAIRLGNPDLWHPAKGGEKPMDLSYLMAVLKSTSFPPYDPWLAGGMINYYYYGFVLIAVPIKLLGIIPTAAYNLVIPTIFSMLGLAGYSLAYNLVAHSARHPEGKKPSPRVAGVAAALALVLLGNLGTVQMYYEGLKRIGTPAGEETGTFAVGVWQAVQGAARYLTLQDAMPYPMDQWYWNPSRAIPAGEGEAGPITEFPFFTFLYADLHAHMISRLLTTLGLAWMFSWLFWADERTRRPPAQIAGSLVLGALALGALYPTNLGDYPTYWGLGAVAAAAGGWVYARRLNLRALVEMTAAPIALLALAYALYLPFHVWYVAGYGSVELWRGSHTALSAYLVVHGLFLWVLASWMAWETHEWMAHTPISALANLRPYVGILITLLLLVLGGTAAMASAGLAIAPLAVPLLLWAAILFLRPGQAVERRVVLALAAAAIALTLVVEVVVAVGDISRMNTVFKFYLQVWELLSVIGGAAFAWLLVDLARWNAGWRRAWAAILALLVCGAALYPLVAGPAKVRDRWATDAPHKLDGMSFMPYPIYSDLGREVSLQEDYRAILWLQDQVQGSPVIVEANTPEYRWGSRFTIYTGLPGVLGWNWHQRQQRAVGGDQVVVDRALDINDFYLTRSVDEAMAFLKRYDVTYVIVGQLERIYFESIQPCLPSSDGSEVMCNLAGWPMGMPNPDVPASSCTPIDPAAPDSALTCPTHGLEKFAVMVQQGLLKAVYQDGGTTIYEVAR
jgi:YYY domain-containing protein